MFERMTLFPMVSFVGGMLTAVQDFGDQEAIIHDPVINDMRPVDVAAIAFPPVPAQPGIVGQKVEALIQPVNILLGL